MDFIDKVEIFSKRVESFKSTIQTEEATKTSIIMPLFQLLGYDIFDPSEFVPEYTADIGIKKGEKVDYAIMLNDHPSILIEAKNIDEKLDRHGSQLFRYFTVTKARFGILTNGIIYRFYTDLEEQNKMDEKPFYEFNLLDFNDTDINILKRFKKECYNEKEVFESASELKYTREIKSYICDQLDEPSDEFISHILSNIYQGKKTQAIVAKFKPIIKKGLNYTVSELVNNKIKIALNSDSHTTKKEEDVIIDEQNAKSKEVKIITTEEELCAYEIIKEILGNICDPQDITYKDTGSYFSVIYKNNIRKWICRLYLGEKSKYMLIPCEKNNLDTKKVSTIKMQIDTIEDLHFYKDQLELVLKNIT